jgi:predicted nucleic acid-binding protein
MPDGHDFVLDSSIILAWAYLDETSPAVQQVFDRPAEYGAWVPSLWRLEVANALEMNVRRGRRNAAFRDATLQDLAVLPIAIDVETDQRAWGATLQLAALHRLTVYDAAYLELAKRRELPLATLDTELRAAAATERIPLLGASI